MFSRSSALDMAALSCLDVPVCKYGYARSTRIIEAIEKYGETMEREEQSQVAGSLFGAGILAQVIPEVCEPHQFMEDVLGFVRD